MNNLLTFYLQAHKKKVKKKLIYEQCVNIMYNTLKILINFRKMISFTLNICIHFISVEI